MWIINLGTYFAFEKHNRTSNIRTSRGGVPNTSTSGYNALLEREIFVMLIMMASGFTLAYAPSIVVIAVENLWPSKIDFYNADQYSVSRVQFSFGAANGSGVKVHPIKLNGSVIQGLDSKQLI